MKSTMKRAGPFFFFFLLVFIVAFSGGCATLPNVSEMMDEVPTAQEPRQIVSVKGLLSPKQSKALMERLQRSVDATDMLQRYSAVIESVSESPLTKGNKVTLLVDSAETYAAMFKAVENARDHIHIETYTIEDIEDKTGRKFADLLLQKQAEGVQVNLIYDSLGNYSTPVAFFERLRDGVIRTFKSKALPWLSSKNFFLTRGRDRRGQHSPDGTISPI